MDLNPVIAHLKAQLSGVRQVGAAADLSAAQDNQLVTPAVFALPQSETVADDDLDGEMVVRVAFLLVCVVATSGDKGALGRQLAAAFAALGLTMPTSASDYQSLVAKYRGTDDANVEAYNNALGTLNAISQSITTWATNDQPILKATEEYLNNKGIGRGQLESSLAGDGYSQSDIAAWVTKYNAAANPAWAGMAKGITDFVKNNLGVDFDVSAWDSVATAQTQLAAAISAVGNAPAKLQTLLGLSPNIEKYFATASDTTTTGPSADDLAKAIANALSQLRDISYLGLDQDTTAQREATRLTTEAKSQFQTQLKDVDLSSVKSLQAFAASLDATDAFPWLNRTSGFGSIAIRGVAYGSGLFVAVGYDGVMTTSPDGITWTALLGVMRIGAIGSDSALFP